MKKVYIIILTYKGWKDTIECLESVLKSTYANYQVIVVDNHSPDDSLKRIKLWALGEQEAAFLPQPPISDLVLPLVKKPLSFIVSQPNGQVRESYQIHAPADPALEGVLPTTKEPLIIIPAPDNLGYSYGNNIGLTYALAKGDGAFFWILNNDTVVDQDALKNLVATAETLSGAPEKMGIMGSKLLFYYAPETLQGVGGKYNRWTAIGRHVGAYEKDTGQYDHQKLEQDYVIGASLFVDANFVTEVGLLNEEYFLYFEEPDWIIRGQRKGWGIGYCYQAKVYHKEGGFSGTAQKGKDRSVFSDYYGLRNRLIFTRKFYPYALPVVYLSFFAIFINRLKRKQYGRLKLAWRAMRGKLGIRFVNEYEEHEKMSPRTSGPENGINQKANNGPEKSSRQ